MNNQIAHNSPGKCSPISFKRAMELFDDCGDMPPETYNRSHPELTSNEKAILFFLRMSYAGSRNTIKSYARNVCRLLNYFLELGLGDFSKATPEHITGYAAHLKRAALKPGSIRTHMAVVKAFYSLLVNYGMLSGDPAKIFKNRLEREAAAADKVAKGRITGHLTKTLTQGQMDSLLAKVMEEAPVRDAVLISFLYHTGARSTELYNKPLTWSDVYETGESKWFVMFEGKGGKQREVYVPAHVVDHLMLLRRQVFQVPPYYPAPGIAEYPIFSQSHSREIPLGYDGIYRTVRKWGEACGLELNFDCKNIAPHWMRHTYATHLLDRGATIEQLQPSMGHASPATTLIYAKHNARRNPAGQFFERATELKKDK